MKRVLATAALLSAGSVLYGQDLDRQQQIRQLEDQLRTLRSAPAQPTNITGNGAARVKPGAKQPGVKRIGVVIPKAQLGQGAGSGYAGESIREVLIQHLTGPSVELVPLAARIPIQIAAEAKEDQCDYVLETEVALAKKGGGFGKLAHLAQPAASMIPFGGLARGAGGIIAASTAITTAGTLAGLSGNAQPKDEGSLDFRLTGDGQVVLAKVLKRPVKSAGEDVLTPLVEQAAVEITAAILKP